MFLSCVRIYFLLAMCPRCSTLNLESFPGTSPAVPWSPPLCYTADTHRPEGICLASRDMYSSIKHVALLSVGWTGMSRRWAGAHVGAFGKSANVQCLDVQHLIKNAALLCWEGPCCWRGKDAMKLNHPFWLMSCFFYLLGKSLASNRLGVFQFLLAASDVSKGSSSCPFNFCLLFWFF